MFTWRSRIYDLLENLRFKSNIKTPKTFCTDNTRTKIDLLPRLASVQFSPPTIRGSMGSSPVRRRPPDRAIPATSSNRKHCCVADANTSSRNLLQHHFFTVTNGAEPQMPLSEVSRRLSSVSDFSKSPSSTNEEIDFGNIESNEQPTQTSGVPGFVGSKRTAQGTLRTAASCPVVKEECVQGAWEVGGSSNDTGHAVESTLQSRDAYSPEIKNVYAVKPIACVPSDAWKTQHDESDKSPEPPKPVAADNSNSASMKRTVWHGQKATRPSTDKSPACGCLVSGLENLSQCNTSVQHRTLSPANRQPFIDLKQARDLVNETILVTDYKLDTSTAATLNRFSKNDPAYPPLASEFAEFSMCSGDDDVDSDSDDEADINMLPFEAYKPTRIVLLDIVHVEVERYQPTLACSISEFLLKEAQMIAGMDIVSFVEILRTDSLESRRLVEKAVVQVLDVRSAEQAQCPRCGTDGYSELVKQILYSELNMRIASRYPWLAADITDTLMNDDALEVLHLLLNPGVLFLEMKEVVEAALKQLNARQRRKVLRQDMTIRLLAVQPEKNHKVLAQIMRGKDSTLLDLLLYPNLLESHAREALAIVRLNEERAREKRVARKQEIALAVAGATPKQPAGSVASCTSVPKREIPNISLSPPCSPDHLQAAAQRLSTVPTISLPSAPARKAATPAVKRRKTGHESSAHSPVHRVLNPAI